MHAAGALIIERAVTTAHANIPVLTGAPFVGTASATNGTTDGITVSFTLERKSAGLAGTITVAAGGQTLVYTFSGSVNRRRSFVLHARSGGHKTLTSNGTASADGKTLCGKLVANSRHNSSRGNITASR